MKEYAREQFIFVMQDVRGRYASEGQFVHMRPQRAANAGLVMPGIKRSRRIFAGGLARKKLPGRSA
jgi:hypothetical protein